MYQNSGPAVNRESMPSIVKILRVVADPNRLRILLLLQGEELSVAELQEILVMGQSTISTHLSQLKQAGLVEDRRTGKSSLYHFVRAGKFAGLERRAERFPKPRPTRPPCAASSKSAKTRCAAFFDSVAGRLGKNYVPGKSWKSLAEALLRLMPPMVVADLGAGEGAFSLLLAQHAKKVIAVDSSAKMIEVGREQARRHGIKNLDFRVGDMEEIPIEDAEVDLAFFSQSLHHALHPERAVAEAFRILRPAAASSSSICKAPLRRSPRTLRRRVARLQRSRPRIHAREGRLRQCPNLRSRQGARNPPVPDPPGCRQQTGLTHDPHIAANLGHPFRVFRKGWETAKPQPAMSFRATLSAANGASKNLRLLFTPTRPPIQLRYHCIQSTEHDNDRHCARPINHTNPEKPHPRPPHHHPQGPRRSAPI